MMLRLERIGRIEEALAVALIRNECRRWMTHDTSIISVEKQVAFCGVLSSDDNVRLFLAYNSDKGGIPVGYGLIRIKDNKACLTGGLARVYRGNGLGYGLFRALICKCIEARCEPWLEVLKSNRRAIRLYKSLGFRITKRTKRLLVMDYPKYK